MKLHFYPPEFDHFEFNDADKLLNDGVKLIQSLRGFACYCSMLIPAYYYFISAEIASQQETPNTPHKDRVKNYFFRKSMLNQVLLYIRMLCESDKRSLASGTISYLLNDNKNILYLKNYLKKNEHWNVNNVDDFFDSTIRFLKYKCKLLSEPNNKINSKSHPISRKVALVRRATNKGAAHITLDDYKIASNDIHDLFVVVIYVGQAIKNIMGDSAVPSDYCETEISAIQSACEIFDIKEFSNRIVEGIKNRKGDGSLPLLYLQRRFQIL